MANINSYLTFSGNCREAMTFYKECLGGKLTLQTVGESPLSQQMPEQMRNHILHATLKNDDLILMASDMAGANGVQKGNSISMMLNCKSENEIHDRYQKLSGGGQQTHPIELTFWGALFGDLTDKFGNHWFLNFQSTQNQQTTDN
jgi:PhnB protein